MIFYFDKSVGKEGKEMWYIDMMTLRQHVRMKESSLYRYLKKIPKDQKILYGNKILYPYTVLKLPKIKSKLEPEGKNR